MTAGLRVDAITVEYSRMAAVRDLSLEVAPGELVALLGRNGAGKTTTLRAICGLQRVASGSIVVDDVRVHNTRPWRVARLGVGMVLENARVLGGQTVAENLELGALAARDRAAAAATRDRMLEEFPVLREKLDEPAALLSGGERGQLAIAQALIPGPSVLLLDEPSVGLAPAIVDRVFALLDRLRRDGGPAVLLAEQQVAKTLRVVDRAVVIDGGRVVRRGTVAELRDAPELLEDYLGRARV